MATFLLDWLSQLLTWRTAFIFYVLFNLKSIPLSWHLRALYHFLRSNPRKPFAIFTPGAQSPTSNPLSPRHDVPPHLTLFAPCTITTRTPLLETDFNLHKSNSTFFTDLDISRLVLMSRVYFAGFTSISTELHSAGHTGRMSFTLGSVYCSFRRPLAPYEPYQVHSRVLSWDRKWLYILSWFSRKGKGEEEVLACAISKYVCKKGRFTVAPWRLLRAAGLLPGEWKEEGAEEAGVTGGGGAAGGSDDVGLRHGGNGLTIRSSRGAEAGGGTTEARRANGHESAAAKRQGGTAEGEWERHREREVWGAEIEAERRRGMDAVGGFVALDEESLGEVVRALKVKG